MSFAQDETWIEIVPSDLVPIIAGDSARSQGKTFKKGNRVLTFIGW